MEQHPIPRQITTFEFKLIGFLTIKQFIYLIVFIPIGFIVYYIFPVPLLNILLGVLTGGAGFAFAFLPVNDRPLDVWIRNFFKRLNSPTQYLYQKGNQPLYFLKNLLFVNDPHRIMAHVEAQEKLSSYLASKKSPASSVQKKQAVNNLFQMATSSLSEKSKVSISKGPEPTRKQIEPQAVAGGPKKPFFTGIIKNHRLIPIPGVLVYMKDEKGNVLRLLKSNPHGIFATFNPVPPGEYQFEVKDANNSYFFDTMKINISSENPKPFELYSKELL